jgi:hypothetical protein
VVCVATAETAVAEPSRERNRTFDIAHLIELNAFTAWPRDDVNREQLTSDTDNLLRMSQEHFTNS